jgi:hypothetical protein
MERTFGAALYPETKAVKIEDIFHILQFSDAMNLLRHQFGSNPKSKSNSQFYPTLIS